MKRLDLLDWGAAILIAVLLLVLDQRSGPADQVIRWIFFISLILYAASRLPGRWKRRR